MSMQPDIRSRFRSAGWVIAATAIGAVLRLYRLDQQSLWYDDFNSYSTVLEPTLRDLWDCVFGVGSVHGEQVPLNYLLQYGWSRLAGTSIYAIRLLPVLLGIAIIPLAFATARQAFGRNAGIFAALCVALSPVHLFYSQEPRYSSLLVLLGTVSVYGFLRAVRTEKTSWWGLNALANFLLLWTHLFGAFLIFAQGLYLVFRFRDSWRRTVAWTVAHAILVIPSLLWILRVNMPETSYECYRAPNLRELFVDLVADDAVNINSQVLFSEDILSRLFFDKWMGYMVAIPFTACLLWAGYRAFRDRRAPDNPVLLLLLVAVVPVAVLGTISILWRPCIFPRYTMYSSIALYALAGGAIQSISVRNLRPAAAGVVLLLLGYQVLHLVPNATRIQWGDAARFVASEAGPRDVVLVGWPGGSSETAQGIFEAQYPNKSTPVLQTSSVSQACSDLTCIFAASDTTSQIWVVFQTNFTVGPPAEFELCVKDHGMAFERTIFPAMGGVSVYRVTPITSRPNGDDGCDEIRMSLTLDAAERGNLDWARELAQSAADGSPTASVRDLLRGDEAARARFAAGLDAQREGREALARGNLQSAARSYRQARRDLPELDVLDDDLLSVLVKIGLGTAERGENARALKMLEEAASMQPVVNWVCRSIMDRLRAGQSAADAVAAVRMFLLASSYEGQPEEEVRRYGEAVAKDPSFAAGYSALGQALLTQGKYQEALDALNRHNERIPDWPQAWFTTGRILLALGETAGAGDAFRKCFSLDAQSEKDYGRLVGLLTGGRDAQTIQPEIERMKREGVPLFPELIPAP